MKRRPGDISHERATELRDSERTFKSSTLGTKSGGRRTLRRPHGSADPEPHNLHFGRAADGSSNRWLLAMYGVIAALLLVGAVLGVAGLLEGDPPYREPVPVLSASCTGGDFGQLDGSIVLDRDNLTPALIEHVREYDLAVVWTVEAISYRQRWAFTEDGPIEGRILPESSVRVQGNIRCSAEVQAIDGGSWNAFLTGAPNWD